ncbi:MAG: RtcB family protein [Nanoarchaeota archaeon]|nr:RtcB family protein [Nanoarchaeota archaeon]
MIKQIAKNIWEISKEGKMNVPGIVFASEALMNDIKKDKTLEQINNVAMLPGIVKKSIAMPDAHQGYGFPVGGVAAFDLKTGIISPGGIGYDINCGVRLLVSNLDKKEFLKKRKEVIHQIKRDVPSGVGRGGEFKLDDKEINQVLESGVSWAVSKGFGNKRDIENCEDSGCIPGADAKKVSQKARGRGRNQLGTLGAGNHFLEVQEVEKIFDEEIANVFGLKKEGQIVVLIHSGSRGLGHQTASDYIKAMENAYGFSHLPDRELASAPIESQLAKDYLGAMRAAANFAFVNRHLMMCKVRGAFKSYFPKSKLDLVYDIAHNIAKFEEFEVDGFKRELCVHRKGATRSFGIGRKELPKIYQKTGQPIFIPGSMGTYSYVLVGTNESANISFSSTAHGAGRVLSRTYAKKHISIEKVKKQLKEHDVYIEANSEKGMVEEAPEAYKDVNEVVRVSHELGIGNLVVRLKPLAVIKG